MKVCVVYDCLFPWTIGGAERHYRDVAERLAAAGHEVTYLTARQWSSRSSPDIAGVEVKAVAPRLALYTASGRRRIVPSIVFGVGVLVHLVRHGRAYDAVHTASFPYFSVLAAAAARASRRSVSYRLVVDWHECWTRDYWRNYLGPRLGDVGWFVQAWCGRVRQHAFCFAEVTAGRLRSVVTNGEVTLTRGHYDGPHRDDATYREPRPAVSPPRVVFAGRHLPTKRVPALVAAIARARETVPDLTLHLYGDATADVAADRPDGVVRHGVVATEIVEEAFRTAACLALASSREGFGLVVVEAAAVGCPSVVVDGPDNAAVELVQHGINGVVVASADPADLAAGIVDVLRAGDSMRRSTARWYAEHAEELSLRSSMDLLVAAYSDA